MLLYSCGAIFASNVNTKESRQIAKLPLRRTVATLNSDETLLAGAFVEGDTTGFTPGARRGPRPQPVGPHGKQLNKAEAKEVMLDNRLKQALPMAIFTVNVKTGEIKVIHRATEWLNHLQTQTG